MHTKSRDLTETNNIRPYRFGSLDFPAKDSARPSNVLEFPGQLTQAKRTGSPQPRLKRPIILLGIAVIHLAVLISALLLSTHPKTIFDPDKLIDLMDMAMPPPPKPVTAAKKIPVNVLPDEQRLQVKDEKKPAIVEATNPPSTEANGDGSSGSPDVFLPQSRIDVAPAIPVQQIKANIRYPEMAQKMSLEALVILELFIDQNGIIKKISVLKDPGHGFAEAAIKSFEGLTVTPAMAGGVPVAVRWRYPVRFTLK